MKKLNDQQKKRLKEILKNAAIIFAVGFLYFIFIKITHHGIPCIFNLITKLHCPGCGISRMFISLASLDFKAAFSYNAFIMLISPFALFFIIKHYVNYVLKGKQKAKKHETVFLVAALVLAVIFGILRNIPAFSFLAP